VKAVLPVHLYGHPAEMNDLVEIANRNDLILIEDACQAHGSAYGGKKTGTFGKLGCFSFYPTKNLGAYGDGGAVVTDDRDLAERVRLLRCYGEKQKYRHLLKGTNSRLDEVQAAVLRVKLRYLDQWNEVRRKKARAYDTLLSSLPVIRPVEKEHAHHVYHLYVIRTRKRDRLRAFLKERKIDTLIHYPIPIHLQKAYRELGYRRGDLPWTERCSREILSLPFFPEMTEAEMEEVAREMHSFFGLTAAGTRRRH
jgi:dTDP-4-amino-4,6-dideoxygalactose transaminase